MNTVVLPGDRVLLRPVTAADQAPLRRILATDAVARWWGDLPDEPDWPADLGDEVRFAVVENDRVVGLVQYGQEADPMYRHAGIDIFLDPAVHGRGLGRDAVRTLARHLLTDLGHHRLVIDPAATNTAAIRAYSAVGFRPVGVLRQYERNPDGAGWHDCLLMDLLAGEFR